MKKLFLTFAVAALAFTACKNSDNDNRPRNLQISTPSVTNSISTLAKVDATVENGATDIVLASGPITGGGFTMMLPGTLLSAQKAALRTFTVPSGVISSDVAAMYFPVEFRGKTSTNTEIGLLTDEFTSTDSHTEILYWYFDRDVKIIGSNVGSIITDYDLKLTKGWNRILQSTNAITGTVSITSPFSSPIPPTNWTFYSSTPQPITFTAVPFTGDVTGLSTLTITPVGMETVTINGVTLGTGNFTATLPIPTDVTALAPFFGGTVPTGIVLSVPAAEYFAVEFRGKDAGGILDGFLVNQSTPPTSPQIVYWYVDRDVTITGYYTATPQTITYNTRLKQGWNRVLITISGNDVIYTSPVPAGTTINWSYSPNV